MCDIEPKVTLIINLKLWWISAENVIDKFAWKISCMCLQIILLLAIMISYAKDTTISANFEQLSYLSWYLCQRL